MGKDYLRYDLRQPGDQGALQMSVDISACKISQKLEQGRGRQDAARYEAGRSTLQPMSWSCGRVPMKHASFEVPEKWSVHGTH
jgi:hypothetical protein